jgi:hypothetical protein
MWDHPSGKSAASEIKSDMDRGVIREFGRVVGTTRGYAVAEVKDYAELLKLTEKYTSQFNVRFSSVEPVLSLEELLRAASG